MKPYSSHLLTLLCTISCSLFSMEQQPPPPITRTWWESTKTIAGRLVEDGSDKLLWGSAANVVHELQEQGEFTRSTSSTDKFRCAQRTEAALEECIKFKKTQTLIQLLELLKKYKKEDLIGPQQRKNIEAYFNAKAASILADLKKQLEHHQILMDTVQEGYKLIPPYDINANRAWPYSIYPAQRIITTLTASTATITTVTIDSTQECIHLNPTLDCCPEKQPESATTPITPQSVASLPPLQIPPLTAKPIPTLAKPKDGIPWLPVLSAVLDTECKLTVKSGTW